MSDSTTFTCPHCGEPVPRKALACPHCGSDDTTGWSSNTYLDGIDLPDDDEYQQTLHREFGDGRHHWSQRSWIVITGIVVLIVFVVSMVSVLR